MNNEKLHDMGEVAYAAILVGFERNTMFQIVMYRSNISSSLREKLDPQHKRWQRRWRLKED